MDKDPDDEFNWVVDGIERAVLGEQVHGKPPDGIPWGLMQGYLGTLLLGGGYEVFYDPELLDAVDLRRRIRSEIGDVADQLVLHPTSRSARRLADLLRRLAARDWHPAAKTTGFAFGLNAADAVIEVQVDESAPADLVVALTNLDEDLIRATARGRFLHRGQPSAPDPQASA